MKKDPVTIERAREILTEKPGSLEAYERVYKNPKSNTGVYRDDEVIRIAFKSL